MTSGESEKIKVDGTLYQKHAQGGIIFTEKNRGARKHRVTQALGFWKLEETVCRVAGARSTSELPVSARALERGGPRAAVRFIFDCISLRQSV